MLLQCERCGRQCFSTAQRYFEHLPVPCVYRGDYVVMCLPCALSLGAPLVEVVVTSGADGCKAFAPWGAGKTVGTPEEAVNSLLQHLPMRSLKSPKTAWEHLLDECLDD